MAFIIRLKSSTTSKIPASLAEGEAAYSFVAGDSDNGSRLYIGTADSVYSILLVVNTTPI